MKITEPVDLVRFFGVRLPQGISAQVLRDAKRHPQTELTTGLVYAEKRISRRINRIVDGGWGKLLTPEETPITRKQRWTTKCRLGIGGNILADEEEGRSLRIRPFEYRRSGRVVPDPPREAVEFLNLDARGYCTELRVDPTYSFDDQIGNVISVTRREMFLWLTYEVSVAKPGTGGFMIGVDLEDEYEVHPITLAYPFSTKAMYKALDKIKSSLRAFHNRTG